MNTATIDSDALNSLFDNQKRLDDIFNSVFDDDLMLDSPISSHEYSQTSSSGSSKRSTHDRQYDEGYSYNTGASDFIQSKRSIAYFVLPVIEIAVIYYAVVNFT